MDDLTSALDQLDRATRQRDAALADAVLDEDFVLMTVQPAAAALSRPRYLEVLLESTLQRYDVQERHVDIDGDCASVLQRVSLAGSVLDVDRTGVLTITDLWRRRADGWRLWRRHTTPDTPRPLPGTGPDSVAGLSGRDDGPRSAAATVSEVAAVLAALAEGRVEGPDAVSLSPQEIQEYVEAFRALRLEGEH